MHNNIFRDSGAETQFIAAKPESTQFMDILCL